MRPHDHPCQEKSHQEGFTIIELMLVLTITAILAAIAIPSFSGYVYRSRATEATEQLSLTKLSQDSYRSEFGVYAQIYPGAFSPTLNAADALPDKCDNMKGQLVDWPDSSACVPGAATPPRCAWRQLGAEPEDRQVRFGFDVTAGTEADMAAIEGAPWNWPTTARNHWYVIHACADLNDDGTPFHMEVTSLKSGVWTSHRKGWE